MYLYFDKNGNLKEIVSEPIREGNIDINTIYAYVEKEDNEPVDNVYLLPTEWPNAKISFQALDSEVNLNGNSGTPIEMTKLTGDAAVQIPYDSKRDLYFFKYGYKYEVFAVDLPATVTDESGIVESTITLFDPETTVGEGLNAENPQFALNTFSFNVEASVGVTPDSTMTQSQYSYLYNQIQKISGIDVDDLVTVEDSDYVIPPEDR